MLRPPTADDLPFAQSLAPGITETLLQAPRFHIIEYDGRPVGVLMHFLLWENHPYLELIIIAPEFREKGLGRQAVRAWEAMMVAQNLHLVLVSTQEDETAQHFWRHLGYQDCGHLALPNRPRELLLYRTLHDPDD